jgi:TP901 family phage tail tape measure protein
MAKKKITYAFGADLSGLERGWKRIDRQMRTMSAKMERTGRAMTTAFTVPLAAIGTMATKAALDVDKALQNIARGTGATGKALGDLQKEWRGLAGSVSQNFETSAQVLADYNTRLGLTGKALSGLSKQALDAGRMMGEDVTQVVAESSKAMQDWGVKAGEMAAFMDKIFIASQSTGIGMAKLSSQMYKYGSALRQMGFDANDTVAMLAQFEKQGVNTELVLGSLRIALGQLAKAGITDAGEAFRQLAEDIKRTESPAEAVGKAIKLFGARAGADMAAAIREGRFEVGELAAALETAQGAIERNSDATKTFGDQWAETKNQVSLSIEPIGREILKLANSVLPSLQAKAESLGVAIGNMSDESKKKMIALAGVLAAGGPLAMAMSATLTAVRTLGTAMLAFATGPAAPLVATAAAVWAIVEAFKALNDMMSKTSEIQKRATGMTPEQVMNRQRYREMAGEIYRERHGKYPVTAPDFKELDSIVDELLAEARKRMQQQIDMKGYAQRTEVLPSPGVPGGTIDTATPATPAPFQGLPEAEAAIQKLTAAGRESVTVYSQLAQKLASALNISEAEAEKRLESAREIGVLTSAEITRMEKRNELLEEARMIAEQVNATKEKIKDTTSDLADMTKLWVNDLARGLADAIVNAKDLGDVLQSIAKQIASSALQKLIGGWIGGLFADGAAFQDGRVIPFAKGGIVTKPTIFPMARGMGLMGEAGPEAVMPLKRGADGSLGVQSEGGGGTHITMNINAVDSRSFVEMMRSNRASVESIVVENIMKNGALRSAIRGLA